MSRGNGENGGKVTGIKKHNWKVQNRGDVKNSIGSGEAKKLMIHRHELRGDCQREEEYQEVGNKRGKIGQL